MKSIDERVTQLILNFLQVDHLDAKKSVFIEDLDSIAFIELVVAIEMEFDIELYDEELIYDPNISIQKWIDIVKERIDRQKDFQDTRNPLLS